MLNDQAILARAIAIAALAAHLALAQTAPNSTDSNNPIEREQRLAERLGTELQRLGDWSSQVDPMDSFVERIWAENEWNTESDLFAKRLNQELVRIPPWEIRRRMSKLAELTSQRYGFSPAQSFRFQARLYSEAFGFLGRHADILSRQVGEYVQRRIQHLPLTPQDVQRWTRESDPIMSDLLNRFNRTADALKQNMNEEQRALLEKDRASFDRQMQFWESKRAAWAKGEWRPEDWGMENDAIQRGELPIAQPAAPAIPNAQTKRPDRSRDPAARRRARRALARKYIAEDETSWARFVRAFIRTHKLDAGQREAIQSILAELEARAAKYRHKHADDIARIATADRPTSKVLAPIRDMFDELQRRAAGLLTRTQRSADNG